VFLTIKIKNSIDNTNYKIPNSHMSWSSIEPNLKYKNMPIMFNSTYCIWNFIIVMTKTYNTINKIPFLWIWNWMATEPPLQKLLLFLMRSTLSLSFIYIYIYIVYFCYIFIISIINMLDCLLRSIMVHYPDAKIPRAL